MDGQGTQHQFNQNIGSWNVGEVIDMRYMFNNSIFNQDIGNWDTSKVTNMSYMFASNGNFNQDINTKDYTAGNRIAWDVSSCINFSHMFAGCTSFISSVDKWKIYTGSNNVDMSGMFLSAKNFNSSLNTSQVTVGQGSYQQTYLAWDIQKVDNLSSFFRGSPPSSPPGNNLFNSSLSNWDTSNVSTIQETFKDVVFNQPLINQQVTVGTGSTARTYNAWDVSNVTNMYRAFRDNNAFNQDLSSWDINTSGNVNMSQMFYSADSFDQNLSNWTVTNVNNFSNFLTGVALLTTNYDAILTAWDGQGAMAYSGTVDFGNSVPSCDNAASNGAFAARASLITKWGGITDKFSQNNTCQPLAGFDYSSTAYCANGSDVTPTITGTVDQTLPLGGTISDAWSAATYINPLKIRLTGIAGQTVTVPTYNSSSANYTIVWGDGQESYGSGGTNIFNFRSHTYDASTNTAVLEIGKSGDQVQPLHLSYRSTFSPYITEVIQWGNTKWETLTVDRAANLTTIPATEVPQVANNVTTAWNSFFQGCSSFTGAGVTWNNWNTVLAKITSLTSWFKDATSFNGDISGFNTSTITSFSSMFNEADAFNIDISSWDVSNGTTYANMFLGAGSFAKSLENWVLGSNAAAGQMFRYASAFGQTNTFNMDTLVGWGVYAYNNSNVPSGVTLSQFSGSFNGITWIGTQTTNSSGVAYSTQYGAQWPSGWTNAQSALDYLVNTAGWTIN
jgi:surface protein